MGLAFRGGAAKRYGERADFIVEGKDQTRGWFYSLLGSGVVLNNEIPYKRCSCTASSWTRKGRR